MRTPARSIENECFAVEADADDGTLTVTDKRTGRAYAGLNRFVDGGDRGDEYNYCVPETETVVDRPVGAAEDPRRALGARRAADRSIELTYALPARLAADRASRSERSVEERIASTITLTDGVPRVDVQTVVEQRGGGPPAARALPVGRQDRRVEGATSTSASSQRPIALPEWDPATWMEEPLGTYPQKAFVSRRRRRSSA